MPYCRLSFKLKPKRLITPFSYQYELECRRMRPSQTEHRDVRKQPSSSPPVPRCQSVIISSADAVSKQTWTRTDGHKLCAIMNKVHPTLQRYTTLSPQVLHSVSKRHRRPLVVARSIRLVRENRLVKVARQVPPIHIGHRPHRPNDTSETAKLHGCGEMEHLVRDALVRQLRGVTSGQEGELGIGELRSHDVEQRKACPSMELERSLEWPPWLEDSVAHDMGERMVPEACQHGGRCSLCGEESRHLGIDGSYDFHLFQRQWHFFIGLSNEKYRRLANRLRARLAGFYECW